MYFGSVKFFKQVIITVIIILIAVPTLFAVHLHFRLSEEEKKVEQFKNNSIALASFAFHYKGEVELAPSDIYKILSELDIDLRELIDIIYENDKNAFESVLNVAAFGQGLNDDEPSDDDFDDSGNVNSEVEDEDERDLTVGGEPEQELLPYMELYPSLYADVMISGNYIDDDNHIYLTFDDGPSENTFSILSYLDKYNLPATFFVVPSDTEGCKNFLNRMLASGHSIGVHTYTHNYREIYASVEAYLDDFNKAYELIYEQTGYKPFLYRFPGGSKNDFNKETYREIIDEMTRRGFVYFDWNVDSQDALGANWTQMYTSVLEQVSKLETAIILFHDGPANRATVYVMDDILRELTQSPRNFVFKAITEETLPRHF